MSIICLFCWFKSKFLLFLLLQKCQQKCPAAFWGPTLTNKNNGIHIKSYRTGPIFFGHLIVRPNRATNTAWSRTFEARLSLLTICWSSLTPFGASSGWLWSSSGSQREPEEAPKGVRDDQKMVRSDNLASAFLDHVALQPSGAEIHQKGIQNCYNLYKKGPTQHQQPQLSLQLRSEPSCSRSCILLNKTVLVPSVFLNNTALVPGFLLNKTAAWFFRKLDN